MLSQLASRVSVHWQRLGQGVPSQCAVCHAWPAQRICTSCTGRFAVPRQRCETCALALNGGLTRCGACTLHAPALDACLAAVDYGYPWTAALAEFKFRGDPGWAAALAGLLRSVPGAAAALQSADWVLPIPLSRERLRERGFNQSLLLARQLARAKADATLLVRLHHSAEQSSLPRVQRLRNLQGAFAAEPLRVAQLQGKRVLLVDDVMTTGATLHTAALALRQAGAAHIAGLVVARTDRHG